MFKASSSFRFSTLSLGVVLLLIGALVALRAEAAPDQPLFGAKSFTLANGMQGVVVETHRVPVVAHMVWYKVGAADEPAGKSGIAHLLEHLMFKGTKTIAPGEYSRIIARNGGEDNAFTSSDYTAYFQTIAADKLPMVMKMEADRMRNLRLTEKVVLTERDVVKEERLSRTENEPSALLRERMDAALWGVHPYSNPVIGWLPELSALGRSDALEFYKRWYAPNNAVLVVVGDVTVDQVKALAEKTYGKVPRGPVLGPRERPKEAPLDLAARVTLHHSQVTQPQWMRLYRAPSERTASPREQVFALQVLSEIMGGSAVSRLYQKLVVEQKLAASAGTGYHDQAVDEGTFAVVATPRPDVPVEQVEAAIQVEIDRLLRDGVSEQEVEDAKRRLRAGLIYARDGLMGAAQTIGETLATGGTLEGLERWPQDVAAVTRDQVMEAARAVLRDESAVTGVLLPQTASR